MKHIKHYSVNKYTLIHYNLQWSSHVLSTRHKYTTLFAYEVTFGIGVLLPHLAVIRHGSDARPVLQHGAVLDHTRNHNVHIAVIIYPFGS